MKYLLLVALLFSNNSIAESFTVTEIKEPVRVCVLAEKKISCALLIAMYRQVKQKHFIHTKGI
jgi:hypothetical protein